MGNMGMDEKNERNERRRMGVMGVDREGWEPCGRMTMRAGSSNGIAAYRTDVEGEGGTKKTILGTGVLWMVLFFALKAVGLLLALSS